MKRLWSFARASVATLALFIIAVGAAPAEEYPSRIVTLIVPYPAGGVVDVVARRVADKLGNAMGKSVIVDNRSGAGGTVGATFVARAKPDGYTLLMGGASTHVFAQSSYPNLAYDPVESFIPITQITSGPLVLVIKSSFPASNLQDFLATTGLTRSPAFPDLPTFDESGFKGFEASAWFGLFAPRGTPQPIIDKIQSEIMKALKQKDLRDQLMVQGDEPVGNSSDQFAAYIKSELDKWPKILDKAGINPR